MAHIPHDDTRDLAVAEATALVAVRQEFYLSRDRGLTWVRQTRGIVCDDRGKHAGGTSRGLHGRTVALSPGFAADGTAYLTCPGTVFRSDDGGRSYARLPAPVPGPLADLLLAPDFPISGHLMARDHDGRVFRSRDRGDSWQLVPAPDEISTLRWTPAGLVVGTLTGTVHRSADGGASWGRLGAAVPGAVTDLLPDAADAGVLAATGDGLYRIAPNAPPRAAGLSGRHVVGLSRIVAPEGTVLFATTRRDSVHRSIDGGATWTPVGPGLQVVPQAVAFGEPDFRQVAALDDGTLLLTGFDGLYRADSVGADWNRLDMTMGHAVSFDTITGPDGVDYLGMAPYVTGIMVSPDGGASWRFQYNGLDARSTSFAFTSSFPEDLQMLSGNRWTLAMRAAADARWRTLQLELVDGVELRGGAPTPLAILPSPDFATDGTVFAGLAPQGVLRSRDGGRNFDLVLSGAGESRSGVVSPNFATDGTVIMTAGGDIHRSRDGGGTWQKVWTSQARRLTLVQGGGAGRAGRDGTAAGIGTLFAAGEDILVRSQDGGDTWAEIALPRTGLPPMITALAASPTFATDGRIFLQMKGAPLQVGIRDGEGFAWRPADTPPGREISPLTFLDAADLFAFSPRFAADRRMYAGAGAALMVLDDAGSTWRDLPPLPRRYEAEYALSDIRSVPLTPSAGWKYDRPELPDSNAIEERIRRFIIRTLYWRGIDGIGMSGENALRAETAGETLRLAFVGTAATVIGPRGSDLGQAFVRLDGAEVGTIDQYAPQTEYTVPLYSVEGLDYGMHILEIAVAGSRNAEASGDAVVLDAFDIAR